MGPLGPLYLVLGQEEGGEVWVECFSPGPCWHFSMTRKSAILATVLGSLQDSENSDNVPAKPPDKVLKVTE